MSKAIFAAGLGFGDEGKGTTVEFLAHKHKAHTVVRYNGGAQAAHNVVLSDGRHHTFSQFGSATFQGVRTYLSRNTLVDPLALAVEALHLRNKGITNPFDLLTVDENAHLITPYHRAVNRIREITRGDNPHGTCGVGVGECMADYLKHFEAMPVVGDLRNPERLLEKLHFVREISISKFFLQPYYPKPLVQLLNSDPGRWVKRYITEVAEVLDIRTQDFVQDRMKDGVTIFEGAQGMLLDQNYGFHPHTTWTDITFKNAYSLLEGVGGVEVERIGVLRSHMTRHGAGPFPTWDPTLNGKDYDGYNGSDGMQGNFRVGPLDLTLLKYALNQIGPLHGLSMTHLDRPILKIGVGYDNLTNEAYGRLQHSSPVSSRFQPSLRAQRELGEELFDAEPIYSEFSCTEDLVRAVQVHLNTNVCVRSYGPRLEDKR